MTPTTLPIVDDERGPLDTDLIEQRVDDRRARREVHGVPVATTLVRAFRNPGFTFDVDDINGDPGAVAHSGSRIVAVIALGVRDRRVDLIHAIGNPTKLRHL